MPAACLQCYDEVSYDNLSGSDLAFIRGMVDTKDKYGVRESLVQLKNGRFEIKTIYINPQLHPVGNVP